MLLIILGIDIYFGNILIIHTFSFFPEYISGD